MLVEKSKQSILLKSCNYFPAGKIHKRPPTSCKNFPRPGVLYSVQKTQIVTSSNFVVRKHKPIANPFNEFSFSSQKGVKKEELSKTKLRSLNSLRSRVNYFSSKRVSLLNTTSKLETKRKDDFDVISGLLVSSSAKSGWGLGWCPSPTLQSDFDITEYLGTWYEAARVKSIPFESGDCVSAQYSLNSDNTVKVVNTQFVDNAYSSREGLAYCEASKSGQCHVRFSSNQPWGDYEVIRTDYENFSIVFSCSNFYVAHYSIAWILARDPAFDPSSAVQALAGLGFAESDFYFTRQSNCPSRS